MSIFVNKQSRVIVQGVTGKEGAFWAKHMKDMGTQVVAGVTPGKEGQNVDGIPVYHSVRRATAEHPADVSMLFVPPKFTKDAVFEALDAGIRKICTIADGIPLGWLAPGTIDQFFKTGQDLRRCENTAQACVV